MTLAKQWDRLKDNWLIIVLVLVLIAVLNVGSFTTSSFRGLGTQSMAEYDSAGGRTIAPVPGNPDFAPQEEVRFLTKSASLSTEVKRGLFPAAQTQLTNILSSTQSILLSENVQNQGSKEDAYLYGWYQIKVPVQSYDTAITQLKSIGDVQSFTESTDDITAEHVNLATTLAAERARLARYQEMYTQATRVEDKIQISDRIFSQEQQVKYLEEALTNTNQRVTYSTIQFSMTEKRSTYANIAFIKFSALARNFVESVNTLLSFLVSILPWALIAALAWLLYKRFHRT